MHIEAENIFWLDKSQRVSIVELVYSSGLTESDIHELVDIGALMPVNADTIPWMFSADCVVTARKASRLRDELELDSHALALTLTLMEQIISLENEISQLRAAQPRFMRF